MVSTAYSNMASNGVSYDDDPEEMQRQFMESYERPAATVRRYVPPPVRATASSHDDDSMNRDVVSLDGLPIHAPKSSLFNAAVESSSNSQVGGIHRKKQSRFAQQCANQRTTTPSSSSSAAATTSYTAHTLESIADEIASERKEDGDDDDDASPADMLDAHERRHGHHITSVLSNIVERSLNDLVPPKSSSFAPCPSGFPVAKHRRDNISTGKDCSRSIFACEFDKERGIDIPKISKPQDKEDKGKCGNDMTMYKQQKVNDTLENGGIEDIKNTEALRIHRENTDKLNCMSESAIKEAQEELGRLLPSGVIDALRRRGMEKEKQRKSVDDIPLEHNSPSLPSNIADSSDDTKEISRSELGGAILTGSTPHMNPNSRLMENGEFSTGLKWLHMENVEPDKLAWMVDVETSMVSEASRLLAASQNTSNKPQLMPHGATVTQAAAARGLAEVQSTAPRMIVRFGFDGEVIPFDADVPTYLGLHHHGAAPDMAGYSLSEVCSLIRSSVPAQRAINLRLLAAIFRRVATLGYQGVVHGSVMSAAMAMQAPLLVRLALDDTVDTVRSAAAIALLSLISPDDAGDEAAVERSFLGYRGCESVALTPSPPSTSAVEGVLKGVVPGQEQQLGSGDDTASAVERAEIDLIDGLLCMNLLPRIRYLLEVCRVENTVEPLLLSLIRIARHSMTSANRVLACPRLIDAIVEHFILPSDDTNSDVYARPRPAALRLIRVLCQSGRHAAQRIVSNGILSSVLRHALASSPSETPRSQVQTEALRVWRVALSYGLGSGVTRAHHSVLVKKLASFIESLVSSTKMLSSLSVDIMLYGTDLLRVLEAACYSAAETSSKVSLDRSGGGRPDGLNTSVDGDNAPLPWSQIAGFAPMVIEVAVAWRQHCHAYGDTSSVHDATEIEAFLFLGASTFGFLGAVVASFPSAEKSNDPLAIQEHIAMIFAPLINCEEFSYMLFPVETEDQNNEKCTILDWCLALVNKYNVAPDLAEFVMCLNMANLPRIAAGSRIDVSSRLVDSASQCALAITHLLSSLALVDRARSASFSEYLSVSLHVSLFLDQTILLPPRPNDVNSTDEYRVLPGFYLCRGKDRLACSLLRLHTIGSATISPKAERAAVALMTRLLLGDEMNVLSLFDDIILLGDDKDMRAVRSGLKSFLENAVGGHGAIGRSRALRIPTPAVVGSLTYACHLTDVSMLPLPLDWAFAPLTALHRESFSAKISDSNNELSAEVLAINSLRLAIRLDQLRSNDNELDAGVKLARLMCVFTASDTLFQSSVVNRLLSVLLDNLARPEVLSLTSPDLDCTQGSKFYDFYSTFVQQYLAVSYGDHLFSCFLLLPLQQRFRAIYRRFVWSEATDILNVCTVSPHRFPGGFSSFLFPAESDVNILSLYFGALASGRVRVETAPGLFWLAVHHVVTFSFDNNVNHSITLEREGSDDTANLMLRKSILRQVLISTDVPLVNRILRYPIFSQSSVSHVQVSADFPDALCDTVPVHRRDIINAAATSFTSCSLEADNLLTELCARLPDNAWL